MTAKPRPGSEDYFGIRIAPGEQLAERFPQVAVRARLYRLEDDGASDLARRKRSVKDSIASRKDIIARIRKRQAGKTNLPPRPQEEADRTIAAHQEAIRRLEAKKPDVAPAVNIVAPVARRVAREDRRRAKKQRD
ncbi:hypothetical protein Achl_4287 (plasmid) [Pseudarthrobacter chlorophenolicus A6]|uniref:Uncharacterized protein n=1 Tax=Pseudarthrobacter chlorophenolicus (strain ATCC 700700 / DSM 12829 / CIP 107037 / JCM 12360 / KCTC 9906 / NCIMB 13794 / A6) TaxID=452863 RepID=B8HIJ1_PSECP|nr:hypothetical protein [Pseudarthrobacter chlorophenolicus]ACL42238.1 hypothetical protein Achl_4287 [Pseudarthrobacter chlorophenolicus A6]SDQ15314.1 hypothetical protein SAMN04489738_0345 [Pseudarthrobacter chlorophenolicus]